MTFSPYQFSNNENLRRLDNLRYLFGGDDMRKLNRFLFTAVLIASFHIFATADGEDSAPDGWRAAAPRDEIRPQFDYRSKGGKDGKGAFLIIADDREGLDGYWVKTFSIAGGRHYRFFALRRVENVAAPSRSVVARILWRDADGKPVKWDKPVPTGYMKDAFYQAEPEYPTDKTTGADGWTEVSEIYLAPSKAAPAVVEL